MADNERWSNGSVTWKVFLRDSKVHLLFMDGKQIAGHLRMEIEDAEKIARALYAQVKTLRSGEGEN